MPAGSTTAATAPAPGVPSATTAAGVIATTPGTSPSPGSSQTPTSSTAAPGSTLAAGTGPPGSPPSPGSTQSPAASGSSSPSGLSSTPATSSVPGGAARLACSLSSAFCLACTTVTSCAFPSACIQQSRCPAGHKQEPARLLRCLTYVWTGQRSSALAAPTFRSPSCRVLVKRWRAASRLATVQSVRCRGASPPCCCHQPTCFMLQAVLPSQLQSQPHSRPAQRHHKPHLHPGSPSPKRPAHQRWAALQHGFALLRCSLTVLQSVAALHPSGPCVSNFQPSVVSSNSTW